MAVIQRKGDRSPVMPPTAEELARHRWHATRRGTVSFAGLGAIEPTLPSVTAAEKFWKNEPGAIPAILWSLTERSAIIGAALFLLGERKNLLKYTLGSAAAIEIAVLVVVKSQIDSGGK
jgi:hypothetical protein